MKNLFPSLLLLYLTFPTFTSCDFKEETSETSINGIWESIGYGRIANIEGDKFSLSDVTLISCTPILNGSFEEAGYQPILTNDTISIKDGINTYFYTRINDTPIICAEGISEEKESDPVYNFEVLAKNFEDHYAYFDLRKVNWKQLYASYRSRVTSETTQPELFNLMWDMLESFNDGHIGLEASEELMEAAEALRQTENELEQEEEYSNMHVAQQVAAHYVPNGLKSSRSKLITWGIMEEDIGYLQINLMMVHANLNLPDSLIGMDYVNAYFETPEVSSSKAHTEMEVQGISRTLDSVMHDFQDTRAMVLDVRFNGGGKDEVALEIMSRFNSKNRFVFTKRANYRQKSMPVIEVKLQGDSANYSKPVYLLQTSESASATEIMILSSLSLDNVKRLGANSEGVFSDVLDKTLPNGWIVGLSNEIYLDLNGNNYEGKGIPPDINLGYPRDGQDMLKMISSNLEADKEKILQLINSEQQ